ncbi:MAG: hypothetical protein IT208_00230 [Chthonomonadales bacterium]|nr:hypothetical protein [Chthonomonadales bacterium]
MRRAEPPPALAAWLRRFRRPARAYTLIPFWFWNDELDEAEIRRQIDDFEAHGVHGFVVHARIGLPESIPFMSERFLHFARIAVEHAARRGMVVHLYDEGMYPSGSACGQVVAANPAHAARCLIRRAVPDGVEPALEPGENLVSVARLPDGRRIAVLDAPSHGKIRGVHFGQDDGEPGQPLAADLLNPEATASFIRLVHERYYAALRPHFGRTVRAIFTDEPDMLGRGHRPDARPWTTGLETWLSRRLGVEVVPRLPELSLDLRPDSAAFRAEVARAVQERLGETFYAPLSRWCAAHGVALTGHPSGPGDIGALRYFQIPGQDIVWRYVEPGKPSALEGPQSTTAKCGASAALHLGRPRNGDEAFGAYGWSFTYEEMRWLTDWLIVRGVDLIWPHAFYYSVRGPRRDERPPDVGPNNTWWGRYRDYADYARRLCALVATGRPRAPIAILGRPDDLPWRAARACFEGQRDFHYLETGHLRDGSARVGRGGIAIRGVRYAALIVEEPGRLDDGTLRALEPLVLAGRVVAYGGAAPPGWAAASTPEALRGWLRARVPPDIVLDPPDPGLRYRHMRQAGLEVFLLFNEGESPLAGRVRLPGTPGARWLVDTRTCEARRAAPGGEVPLSLAPHATLLIVCCPGA